MTIRKLTKAILLALWVMLGLMPASLQANELDSGWYMSVAGGAMRYQQDNLDDFKFEDYRLVIGKNLNRVFALEAHAGTGSEDTQSIFGIPVTLSLDHYVAGFARANLTYAPAEWQGNRLRLFGMLGATHIETTSSDPVTTRSGAQGSLAAGVGIEMFVDNIAVQLGYTRYVHESHNNNDYTLDSLYLGLVYEFSSSVVN